MEKEQDPKTFALVYHLSKTEKGYRISAGMQRNLTQVPKDYVKILFL